MVYIHTWGYTTTHGSIAQGMPQVHSQGNKPAQEPRLAIGTDESVASATHVQPPRRMNRQPIGFRLLDHIQFIDRCYLHNYV